MGLNRLTFDNVLGPPFTVFVDEDSDYLERLLDRYRVVLENTRQTIGIAPNEPLKLAILTGFLLCEEIEKLKAQQNSESKEAEAQILDMIARIDEFIAHE